MKATIVTFHRAHNHGAVLQCYALNRAVNNLGVECNVLDYWPQCFKEWYYCWRPFKITHPPIKTWLRHYPLRKVLKKRNSNFELFIKNNLPLTTPTIRSFTELNNYTSDTDCYIAGSDMIWNYDCCRFDKTYFLDFNDAKNKKRISYAASFGDDLLPQEELNEYKRRINLFNTVSVREEKGKEYVLNLVGRTATVNCDPTLLLTGEQWRSLFDLKEKQEKYIFVYYVELTQELQKEAKKLSEQTGLKVICMPCNTKPIMLSGKNDKGLCDVFDTTSSPLGFLDYLYNSEYVFTNSFHGLVFSLLFHKKFLMKLINGDHINVRAKNLMDKVGVAERELYKFDITKEADWERIEGNLDIIRNDSIQYLKTNLIEE